MTVKFLADENFKLAIVQGLLQLQPGLNIVLVQNVGLRATADPIMLEWAAQERRVLLTHDVNTMIQYAYERLIAGLPMPEVIVVEWLAPIGQAIEDILLLAEFPEELRGQVRYIPL